MVKKIAPIIIISVILIPGTFFLIKYIDFVRDLSPDKAFLTPKAETVMFETAKVSGANEEMTINLEIVNPLPFSLNADSISYNIAMDGQKIKNGSYPHTVAIKRSDSTWLSFPVCISATQMNIISKRAISEKKDSVLFVLHATFYTHLAIKKNFSVQKTKFMPVRYFTRGILSATARKSAQ